MSWARRSPAIAGSALAAVLGGAAEGRDPAASAGVLAAAAAAPGSSPGPGLAAPAPPGPTPPGLAPPEPTLPLEPAPPGPRALLLTPRWGVAGLPPFVLLVARVVA